MLWLGVRGAPAVTIHTCNSYAVHSTSLKLIQPLFYPQEILKACSEPLLKSVHSTSGTSFD